MCAWSYRHVLCVAYARTSLLQGARKTFCLKDFTFQTSNVFLILQFVLIITVYIYKLSFYFIQSVGIFLEITLALSWSGNNYNWNYDAIHAIDKPVTC